MLQGVSADKLNSDWISARMYEVLNRHKHSQTLTTAVTFVLHSSEIGPPLWSSGQSFCLQIQRSRVRFPALPDFLSSSGSGKGSTQPREVN